MSNVLYGGQSQPFTGLGTYVFTAPTTGLYTVSCQATPLPVGSALQIVLAQSGSASNSVTFGGTSTNPAQNQDSIAGNTRFVLVAGDLVTVTVSSSAAVDSLPNAVKGIINLFLEQ